MPVVGIHWLGIRTLRDALLTHQIMAEGLGPLFSNVPPRLS
jgi:hypothetical protein